MPAPMTREERERFLAGVHAGVLSINQPGRGPLAMPLWYVYEPGGEIVIVTRPETRKAKLITSGSRVAFIVQAEDLPPKYVSVEGRVVSVAPDGSVRVAQDDLGSRPAPNLENPYKGLEAFHEADANRFFGRDEVINRLWQRCRNFSTEAATSASPLRLLPVIGPPAAGNPHW